MTEHLKLLNRIKQTQDGLDYIAYLKSLSLENYEAFKKDGSQFNDIHKGYALAIDSLIKTFELCDDKLANKVNEQADVMNWTT